eukprot:2095280-Alexandrium_andersonii.AAC.1
MKEVALERHQHCLRLASLIRIRRMLPMGLGSACRQLAAGKHRLAIFDDAADQDRPLGRMCVHR